MVGSSVMRFEAGLNWNWFLVAQRQGLNQGPGSELPLRVY